MSLPDSRSVVPLVASLSLAAVVACAGCSGANPNLFPDPGDHDAAPPPAEVNPDAGSFFYDGGSLIQEAAAAVCDPQSIAGFKPDWTTPEAWKQGACTAAQISAFYAACLTPPIVKATCDAFVAQSGACATCLQADDTASSSAAVVWHEHRAYWTVNVAGCIARATGDPSGQGCGASYAATIACRQASCNACWAGRGTTTTFAEFATCEQNAGQSTCLSYTQALPAACGDLEKGPGGVCMPPTGATAEQAFLQVAPLFCGN